MIPVYCHTNLDLDDAERWPVELPAVPAVGTRIESGFMHRGGFRLTLEVASVTLRVDHVNQSHKPEWYYDIELHMTSWQKELTSKDPEAARGSITAFYEWYAPKVGRTVGSFIKKVCTGMVVATKNFVTPHSG